MLHNKLPQNSVSWYNRYYFYLMCLLGWVVFLVSAKCQLCSTCLSSSPRTNGLPWECLSHDDGRRQEQTGPVMKHLHASSGVTFANIPLAKPSHMAVQSQSKRALQSHMRWLSGEVKNRYHFFKLSKETAVKMMIRTSLGLISWHLGNGKWHELFVRYSTLFYSSLSGFYLEERCPVKRIQLFKEMEEERRL